jgi:hypothetical protein
MLELFARESRCELLSSKGEGTVLTKHISITS